MRYQILLILTLLTTALIPIVSGSMANLVFAIIILVLTLSITIFIKEGVTFYSHKLIYTTYCCLVLFAIFHYIDYTNDWQNFAQHWRDEYKFYSLAHYYEKVSLTEIYKDCFIDRIHIENEGYIFYISLLSSVAYTFFDGNNLLLLMLGSVFFGVLNAVFLYKILSLFIPLKKAHYYTLLFICCSAFFQYSFWILRDILIAFFYLVGFYVVLRKFTFKGILVLLSLTIILLELRFENGLFFVSFILYYLYFGLKKANKGLLFIFLLIVAQFSLSLGYILYSKYYHTATIYKSFTEEAAFAKENSIGKNIYKLPSPIKEVAVVIVSQIQPFPSWHQLILSKNIFDGIKSLLPIVYSFFWFTVVFALTYWLIFSHGFKLLDQKNLILLLICLLFLILNNSNMALRRLIAVYPFIYLLYVNFKEVHLDKKQAKKMFTLSSLSYLGLTLIYFILMAV